MDSAMTAAVIDDAITFMALAEPAGVRRIPLQYYDRAIALHSGTAMELFTGIPLLAQYRANPSAWIDFMAYMDMAVLMGPERTDQDVHFHLARCKPLDIAVRSRLAQKKLLKAALPSAFVVSQTKVHRSGAAFSHENYFQFSEKHNNWMPHGDVVRDTKDQADALVFDILASLSLSRPRLWFAEASYLSSPRVAMATDPTGIKALFKDRDIPDGAARRPALRHWVTEHWRQSRQDEDAETYVREHLRGATSLGWHGMAVNIKESDDDIIRAAQAVLDRKMRETRRPRRPRR